MILCDGCLYESFFLYHDKKKRTFAIKIIKQTK